MTPDHVVPAAEIGPVLLEITSQPVENTSAVPQEPHRPQQKSTGRIHQKSVRGTPE
jgi:hypothetical protein